MPLKLLSLLLLSFFYAPIKADPIERISDFELWIKQGQRVPFTCPRKMVKIKEDGIHTVMRIKRMYKNCWFELHSDHINIMDRHKIKKVDILSYWDTWNYHSDKIGPQYHYLMYN